MKNSFLAVYSKGAQIFPFTETAIKCSAKHQLFLIESTA